jgi:hypothetical protein
MRENVRSGAWVLGPAREIKASSEFQRKRLAMAVTMARIYLRSERTSAQLAIHLDVTQERAAQIIRLGIEVMRREGWLAPAVLGPLPTQQTAQSISGPGPG